MTSSLRISSLKKRKLRKRKNKFFFPHKSFYSKQSKFLNMEVLIIVGTAREGRKTIQTARLAEETFEQEGYDVVFFDLKKKEVPPLGNRTYVDSEKPVPEDMKDLGNKVESADLVLIVTPEYNHSIPGILKTALDHLYPEYEGKPFCYITDSAGGFGGVRGLSHLHDITLALRAHPGPNLPVSRVGEKFDENGDLKDEELGARMKDFVGKAENHAEKFS